MYALIIYEKCRSNYSNFIAERFLTRSLIVLFVRVMGRRPGILTYINIVLKTSSFYGLDNLSLSSISAHRSLHKTCQYETKGLVNEII